MTPVALPHRILLLNWRDSEHPKAGGAEALTMNWAEAWRQAGAEVTLLANRFRGCDAETCINGVRVVRRGGPLTQSACAMAFDRSEGGFDVVVEEINTLPFFSPLWARGRSVLLMHQLARDVWFYEAPMLLAAIGYTIEPGYLRMYARQPALVLSESTRRDLVGLGFEPERTHVLRAATEAVTEPPRPRDAIFSFVCVGRITPSKRIDHVIKAFALTHHALLRREVQSRLRIVGSGSARYEAEMRRLTTQENVFEAVEFCGWVDRWWCDDRLSRSHVLVMASVREGWGLVVTEANAAGIPAIGYPVNGLRDSIQHQKTGLLTTAQTPEALAVEMLRLAESRALLRKLSTAAFEDARTRDWATSRNHSVSQLALAVSQLPWRCSSAAARNEPAPQPEPGLSRMATQ